jgi:hypothetical protein
LKNNHNEDYFIRIPTRKLNRSLWPKKAVKQKKDQEEIKILERIKSITNRRSGCRNKWCKHVERIQKRVLNYGP